MRTGSQQTAHGCPTNGAVSQPRAFRCAQSEAAKEDGPEGIVRPSWEAEAQAERDRLDLLGFVPEVAELNRQEAEDTAAELQAELEAERDWLQFGERRGGLRKPNRQSPGDPCSFGYPSPLMAVAAGGTSRARRRSSVRGRPQRARAPDSDDPAA
jgi:hypothetical protein